MSFSVTINLDPGSSVSVTTAPPPPPPPPPPVQVNAGSQDSYSSSGSYTQPTQGSSLQASPVGATALDGILSAVIESVLGNSPEAQSAINAINQSLGVNSGSGLSNTQSNTLTNAGNNSGTQNSGGGSYQQPAGNAGSGSYQQPATYSTSSAAGTGNGSYSTSSTAGTGNGSYSTSSAAGTGNGSYSTSSAAGTGNGATSSGTVSAGGTTSGATSTRDGYTLAQCKSDMSKLAADNGGSVPSEPLFTQVAQGIIDGINNDFSSTNLIGNFANVPGATMAKSLIASAWQESKFGVGGTQPGGVFQTAQGRLDQYNQNHNTNYTLSQLTSNAPLSMQVGLWSMANPISIMGVQAGNDPIPSSLPEQALYYWNYNPNNDEFNHGDQLKNYISNTEQFASQLGSSVS